MKRNFLNCASVFKRTDTFFFLPKEEYPGDDSLLIQNP